ncbi:MAG: hypothetical protein IJF54_03300 [Clostridia bacterium]|nr:hypothetical protein [Clostridia bacterium]
MLPIFLYGDPCDTTAKDLSKALRAFGSVIHITSSGIHQQGADSQCFFICETAPKNIDMPFGIAVIKNKIFKDMQLNIPAHFPVIVSSDNKTALSMLQNSPHPIITCGMSVTDTISISSKCETSASVSLQRSFRDFHGNMVEECEIPIKLNCRISDYAISVAVAVLLLCRGGTDGICF